MGTMKKNIDLDMFRKAYPEFSNSRLAFLFGISVRQVYRISRELNLSKPRGKRYSKKIKA
jgi:hypothetical protein